MEQDVDNNFGNLCSTCLSGDRNLMIINSSNQVYQIFRLIMYDFAGDKLIKSLSDVQHVCWECLALMQRFNRFKKQVHNAQEHLRVLAMSRGQEGVDLSHTYMSQSLSSLESVTKGSYDKVYVDYTNQTPWSEHEYVLPEPMEDDNNIKNEEYAQTIRETVHVDPIDTQLLGGCTTNSLKSHLKSLHVKKFAEFEKLSEAVKISLELGVKKEEVSLAPAENDKNNLHHNKVYMQTIIGI